MRAEKRRKEIITALLMLLPALVGLSLFLVGPAIYAFYLGFTNYTLILPPRPLEFIGLHNFVRMFTEDSAFIHSILNTLYFVVLVLPLQCALALGLALLINQKLPGVRFFRALYFFPTVMAMIVVCIIWMLLYNPEGMINTMIGRLGIGPIPFLSSRTWAMPSIVFMSIWQGVGFQMVIFLAGLQAIPKRLYEAAFIDGAGVWQQFRYITLPQLRLVILVVILITTILAFRLFTQPYVMTAGGPRGSTRTIIMYIYQKGMKSWSLGYACAMAVFFFLMVFIISIFQRRFLREQE